MCRGTEKYFSELCDIEHEPQTCPKCGEILIPLKDKREDQKYDELRCANCDYTV